MTFNGFELIGMINLYWHLTPQCPICNRGMCQYYFIAGIGFAFERLGGIRREWLLWGNPPHSSIAGVSAGQRRIQTFAPSPWNGEVLPKSAISSPFR